MNIKSFGDIFSPPQFVAPKRRVNRVFIHCSASDNPKHDDVSVIRQWHLQRSFSGVGYHFFIKFDGTIQCGRNIELTPEAQEGNNTSTIAICCAGLSRFTEAQFNSLRLLVKAINAAIPKATYHGHCEVSKKTCPVFAYKTVLGLDSKGVLITTKGEVL